MKNKSNKINRIMLKKHFTKDQLLIMKRYSPLLAYELPYAVINRAYKRLLKNADDYILQNTYPNYWFAKDKRSFCFAVKIYIASKQNNYVYKPNTRGHISIEIVKLSGLDKYLDKRYV